MEALRTAISVLSAFVLPAILVGFPLYGLYKRVPVYEAFVEGAKEGFGVAVRIIPYLVAILFAIAMFRASGAMDFLVSALSPVLGVIGFPAEVLPMAIVRPLTGSCSAGLVVDMIDQVPPGARCAKRSCFPSGVKSPPIWKPVAGSSSRSAPVERSRSIS